MTEDMEKQTCASEKVPVPGIHKTPERYRERGGGKTFPTMLLTQSPSDRTWSEQAAGMPTGTGPSFFPLGMLE